MRRTNIKAIYRFSYGLGSLFLLLGLLLSVTRVPVQAYQDPGNLASGGSIEVWDKSSLVFLYSGACEGDCNLISAWVENHGSDMQGPTTFEVWYSATGNPMTAPDRQLVYTGVIPALPSRGTFQLTYVPTMTGNYKFRAIQREGHPGSGDLWSQTCYVICQEPSATPTFTFTPTPTDTPEPTPTFTPTATDVVEPTPTFTFTPTATDVVEPTPTFTFTPTATDVVEPTPTFTNTPIPTDTPEPTSTPNPGPTPTATVVIPTATPADPTATPDPGQTPTVPPNPTDPAVTPTSTVVRTLPPPVVRTPSVLIPVTGADMTEGNPADQISRLLVNLGLAFLGLALTLQAFSKGKNH